MTERATVPTINRHTRKSASAHDHVRHTASPEHSSDPGVSGYSAPAILRKASCACGGGCPTCQAKSSDLKISQPNDPAEIEADQIADRVMRMSIDDAKPQSNVPNSSNAIHRKCSACEQDDDEMVVRRKALPSAGSAASHGSDHVRDVIGSGGRALDFETRGFFESRFGYDLSSVRLHTGDAAAESARRLNAHAYTHGHDIVFGSGEYAPHSESGRHLLAHELAHVTQQKANKLHRRLKVNTADSDDPTTAISMIDPMVTQLCPDFETNSTSGEITPKSGTPCTTGKFSAIAAGSQPLGCCCLCTMTRPWGANWKIIVSSTNAPSANSGTHVVRMTPTSGPSAPELRHWTPGPAETTSTQAPVEAFGHELCGHAALMKIRAHEAASTDRAYDDQHDSTVRVQNALAVEMGLGGARRGLAGGGTHRGESLRVFTVGPFGMNETNPAPFAAQIAAAVSFLNGKPELLVDTVGFRGGADTLAGVSAGRAIRVGALIAAGITAPTVDVETSPGVPETLTRVQPVTDGGVGASAVVEIRMAIRPAGLITPIGVAPPSPPVHVDPADPGRVAALKRGSVNECHQLLANTAWP
ncbi:MAG: DUF4157 domain-containing protein [Pyrinomonadaceae bacterium]